MSRSAAGMDYSPFQVFQKLVLSRSRELYYIGGSDVLPAPLEPKREAYVISRLKTDQEQEARSLLIEHNLRLVVYIARKFDNTGVGVEDLISIGTIGLIKAVETFDPQKNSRLAAYAARCIDNELLMMLRSKKKTSREVSLYEPIGTDREGNEINLLDVMEQKQPDIVEEMEKQRLNQKLYELMENVLSLREKEGLYLRYGLPGGTELTQKEVGKRLGISRSYVSRIEKRALLRLRDAAWG